MRPLKSLRRGFTLIELLVVIAIIAILAAMLLPALSKAKSRALQIRCAGNMKNWGIATVMYMGEQNDCLPLFADDSSVPYVAEFWHAKLAPYVLRATQRGITFNNTDIYTNEVRKCPAGSYGPVPFSTGAAASASGTWNCWIGANFGAYGDYNEPLSGPFYYGNYIKPFKATRIKKPSDAMMYMDTITHYVYSPVRASYKFTLDKNGDTKPDTMSTYPDTPFNSGRPTVHNDGSNLTMLDGHVERVAYKKFWAVDGSGNVTHSYWYMDD